MKFFIHHIFFPKNPLLAFRCFIIAASNQIIEVVMKMAMPMDVMTKGILKRGNDSYYIVWLFVNCGLELYFRVLRALKSAFGLNKVIWRVRELGNALYHMIWSDGELGNAPYHMIYDFGVFPKTSYHMIWSDVELGNAPYHMIYDFGVFPKTSYHMIWSDGELGNAPYHMIYDFGVFQKSKMELIYKENSLTNKS